MTDTIVSPAAPRENKMGVMPIPKLLLNMAAPMVFSMLILACYNVVDSFFVAKICENAVTALSLAFPIQQLIMAVSLGIGVGVNALLARALGQRDQETVNKVACQGLILAACGYVLFLLLGFLLVKPFMYSQTDVAEIAKFGSDYLRICCVYSFGVFAQVTFDRILQATGRMMCTMVTQICSAVINIILDPIFIFVLHMDVAGAALATVIAQCCGACLSFTLNRKKNPDVVFRPVHFRFDGKMIGRVLEIGIPSMLMMSVSSIMVFCMNRILIGFSTTAVAVFGLYFKMQSFVLMPVMGMNNGMMPILAYNLGAGKKERITDTLSLAIKINIAFMICGTLLFQLFPAQLLGLFNASDYLLSIGVPALRIISLHFPIAAICIPLGGSFQALGKSMFSLYNALCRQLVILIPVAWLLSLTGNVNAVWFSYVAAEIMSLIMSVIFEKKTMRAVGASFRLPAGKRWPREKEA